MAAPIPVFTVDIKAGRIKVRPGQRQAFDDWRAKHEGQEMRFTLSAPTKQRSLDQNAWIWGIAYPLLADALGYDHHEHEDLHYALMEKCFGSHLDPRLRTLVPNKRSSKLTTKEFSEYMEFLVRFGATTCGGIFIPLPGEAEAA